MFLLFYVNSFSRLDSKEENEEDDDGDMETEEDDEENEEEYSDDDDMSWKVSIRLASLFDYIFIFYIAKLFGLLHFRYFLMRLIIDT